MKNDTESIVLGMGCFWCTEAIFQRLQGVVNVEVGYAGGDEPNPTYQMVCSHNTHYVEVSKITFHPKELSLEEILMLFWTVHDPTTPNQQGADVGEQYRSVIFYANEKQQKIAQKVLAQVKSEKMYDRPIVTSIEPLKNYYVAEDYHQNYYNDNQQQPYCRSVITPKVQKLLKLHADKIKK